MRDEKGKVIKLPHNFEVRSLPKKDVPDTSEKDGPEDEPEVKDISPMLVLEICEHGSIHVHTMLNMDLNKVEICDLKAIMTFIERQKSVIAIALARGGERKNKDDMIPMVVTGTDEEGEIVMIGGARPEDLQGFDEKELLEVIDSLEELRMNLMAITVQKTIAHFMFPHGNFNDDDDDEDDPE